MTNRPDKKLPSRPRIVDGRTRFMNISALRKEVERRPEPKSKVKLLTLSFLSVCLLVVAGNIFISTAWIKSEKKITKAITAKRVPSSKDETFKPLSMLAPSHFQQTQPVAPEPATNYVSSHASPEPDQATGDSYEPFTGTNSDNAYDPYTEDVGRYLAHEEEPSLQSIEEEAQPTIDN